MQYVSDVSRSVYVHCLESSEFYCFGLLTLHGRFNHIMVGIALLIFLDIHRIVIFVGLALICVGVLVMFYVSGVLINHC